MRRRPPRPTPFPYTTLFRSSATRPSQRRQGVHVEAATVIKPQHDGTRKHLLFTDEHEDLRASMEAWVKKEDRKSTRLNSSHTVISYAVFCLKKKTKYQCFEA